MRIAATVPLTHKKRPGCEPGLWVSICYRIMVSEPVPYFGLPEATELTCPYCGQPESLTVNSVQDRKAGDGKPRTVGIGLFCHACDHAVVLKIDGVSIGVKALEGFRQPSNLQPVPADAAALMGLWHGRAL